MEIKELGRVALYVRDLARSEECSRDVRGFNAVARDVQPEVYRDDPTAVAVPIRPQGI